MLFQQLQSLRKQGHLKEAALASTNNKKGWLVEFEKDNGEIVFLSRKDGRPYACKSIDCATRVANKIGFDRVRIMDKTDHSH